jgi:hypothetical protein
MMAVLARLPSIRTTMLSSVEIVESLGNEAVLNYLLWNTRFVGCGGADVAGYGIRIIRHSSIPNPQFLFYTVIS